MHKNKNNPAFTIVELLIVIVIIGILAAITIVSYTGITKKANESSIQADLANAKKQIELYKVIHGQYPTGLDPNNCLTGNIAPSPDTNYCLKKSNSTATYTMSNADGTIYTLKLDNGTLAYKITESTGPTSIAATPIAESFVKAWGGVNGDIGQSLTLTSDGGYAITGYTQSFGASNADIFLNKYSPSGDLSWNKTWGGSGNDYGQGVAQVADGGYLITGYTDSYGAGNGDMFLIKYDTNGGLGWNKTWGGAGVDNGQSLAKTSDGGCIITGYTQSFGAGINDIILVKYDSVGNLSWSKSWGGASSDNGYGIAQTSDGGYIVVGGSQSFGAGGFDVLLIKYDASGNVVWNKTWGGVNSDYGFSMIQTSDGGYAITGQTDSYGAGSADVLLARYDSGGNLTWNKLWGGTSNDIGNSLVQTSSGEYVLIGYTSSFGSGSVDLLMTKYDASGILIWNRTWGGASDDRGYNLVKANDGGYVGLGYTNSYGAGGYDIILAKFNTVGNIISCSAPMCQIPVATITTPLAAVNTPSASINNPSAAIGTPNATITTPTATQTTVVAAP